MDPSVAAQVLFELIDREIEYRAKRIKDSIFSEARHLDWTPEQRKMVPEIVRKELDGLIFDILGTFDDRQFLMPTVPGGPVGYTIHSVYPAEDGEGSEVWNPGGPVKEGPDIKVDGEYYLGMWRDYLSQKGVASRTERPEGRFMVAVGAVIEHPTDGTILLLKRAETADYLPGIWEDPMGRMKQFEEPEEALRREIREECGLEVEIVKPIAIFHDYRGGRTADNEWIGITFWCKARSDKIVLSSEHDTYQWVSPQEALELVQHPGVKRDLEAYMEVNL